ncbi:MBL fold metallo-hydrolase [Vibrio breoganii]|uniref:MBL fold metallo-hydrolase n=2 Tax=Vibrio breoganii TaxID=553239 RepID=UPI001F52D297|nr:MBL fold metallo-hydrolase [Vibrio breoganii]
MCLSHEGVTVKKAITDQSPVKGTMKTNHPVIISILITFLSGCSNSEDYSGAEGYKDGKFFNTEHQKQDVGVIAAMKSIYWDASDYPTPDQPLPIQNIDLQMMEESPGFSMVKIGHSTILIRLNNEYWMFDPMFSDRASPVSFAGPKRYTPPALPLKDVPRLKGVLISHDHFDHLDKESIKRLINKTEHFYVPLGVKQILIDWGVPEKNVTELAWWEQTSSGPVSINATPSQHFSGRSIGGENKTQWVSYVMVHNDFKLYFSGDSGYFSGFKEIGNRYGPFDVTLMENGAYNTLWQYIHLFPKQTIQAHNDLNGKYLVPIHNATFNLSNHAWFEPMEEIHKEAKIKDTTLITPEFGQVVLYENIEKFQKRWWREAMIDQKKE